MRTVTVMFLCAAVAGVWADSQEWEHFVAAGGNPRQTNPDVCGSRVVWQQLNGIDRIYTRLLPDGDAYALSPGGSINQLNPVISGNWIVWRQPRPPYTDIYVYDLNTGQVTVLDLPDSLKENQAIDGDIIVWQDHRNGPMDIYGYNLATEQEIEIFKHTDNQVEPAISGSIVVWSDTRSGTYDIYGIDLNDLAAGEFAIATGSYNHRYPAISGDVIVWTDYRTGTEWNLYGYNRITEEYFTVYEGPGNQFPAAIHGDWVVWSDRLDNSIRGRKLGSEVIEPLCTSMGRLQELPAMSSRYAVWVDQQGGSPPYSDIRGVELPLAISATITVLSPDGGRDILAGADVAVQWHTDGDGVEEVDILFSDDGGGTWQPLAETVLNTGACDVAIPDVSASDALIRVSAAGLPTLFGQSEPLTVFQCNPALTADLTGNCRVGLSDFAIFAAQWLDCGHPTDPTWCME